MTSRIVPIVSATLAIVCVGATRSSAGVTSAPSTIPNVGQVQYPLPRVRALRTVQLAGTNLVVAVTGPSGCPANGPSSFRGEPGSSTLPNLAGGGADGHGFAGVVAGQGNEACDGYTGVVSGISNFVGGNGGSIYSGILGGFANAINAEAAVLVGGAFNSIGAAPPYNDSSESAIVSGADNTIGSSLSFIGAGIDNIAVAAVKEPDGQSAFIGAGYNNNVGGNFAGIVSGKNNTVSADNAAIAGGQNNTVSARWSTIAGGLFNTISSESAAIAGGYTNKVTGQYATIGGGEKNTASGTSATIAGGVSNTAGGANSFAAGTASDAANPGTFVWSDDASGAKQLVSTLSNQFLARASNGFTFYTSASLKSGAKLAAGSGSWSNLSDRASKTGIEDVDDGRILAKVAALPVSEWSYSTQGTGIRHLGPMAQDFRAAFGLGEDEKHISTVDEEGVALAAIKALQAELARKDRENNDRLAEIRRTDDAQFALLEKRIKALAADVEATRARNGS